MNPEVIRENIRNPETWRRFFPMIVLFLIFHMLVQPILIGIMLLQFFSQLLFQKRLENLYAFSIDISNYSRNLWLYLTYNSEQKLFPFADWASSNRAEGQRQEI